MDYKSEHLIESIFQLRLAMKKHLQRKLKEENFDITYEMLQVLSLLWKREDINQKDIAQSLQKDKASITPILQNLEKRNLVVRRPGFADRRNKMISLTTEGRNYKERFLPVLHQFFAEIEKDLGAEQMAQAAKTILKMFGNITSAGC